MIEPSASARRFELRLLILQRLHAALSGIDGGDVLTVLALAFLGVGLTLPAVGLVVVGALLIPITPVGVAIRVLLRGR